MIAAETAAEPITVGTVGASITPAECDAYVAGHPDATAYHRTEWLGIIARAFRHPTRYLVAHTADRIVGVLPLVLFSNAIFGRFAVSLPYLNYGGVAADGPDAIRALVDAAAAEAVAAGGSHVELRHTARMCPGLEARRHKVAMLLPLEATADKQWQALDRKLRNQVRKGEKSGLDVQVGGVELVPAFYRVFARNMRDLGTPVYDIGFFTEVLSTLGDRARVFVISLGGRPVAASIVHWHRGTIEVPWASAIREFNPLCANVLLYWNMLRFAIDGGLRVFDFGRSTPGEGTFLFKQQWGAEPKELVWEYWLRDGNRRALPDLSPKNPKFSVAIRAWQRLPVPVATAIGPLIVRHIP